MRDLRNESTNRRGRKSHQTAGIVEMNPNKIRYSHQFYITLQQMSDVFFGKKPYLEKTNILKKIDLPRK